MTVKNTYPQYTSEEERKQALQRTYRTVQKRIYMSRLQNGKVKK